MTLTSRVDGFSRSFFALIGLSPKQVAPEELQGTLFTDVQRRIGMYLRALWAQDFVMKPTTRAYRNREGYKPYVEDALIHLPDAYQDIGAISGLDLYRAAAAHAAAHLVHTQTPFPVGKLDNWQIAVISAIEDARVEALSMREFPGLKALWSAQHDATPGRNSTAADYLDRLARALLDDNYRDEDPWIVEGRDLFSQADHDSRQSAMEIGLQLAKSYRGPAYNVRTDLPGAPYRDDNRMLWEGVKYSFSNLSKKAKKQRLKKYASFFGMTNDVAIESEGKETKELSLIAAIFNFKLNVGAGSEIDTRDLISEPYHYPEWDCLKQIERESWVTLREKRPRPGNLALILEIIERHKRLIARMKYLLDAIQPEGVQRIRKLEDGDDLDINAVIRAHIDFRLGIQPDNRIMMSSVKKTRDISVLVLLDLSKSTTQRVPGQPHTILELTREACVLLADAIQKVGDPFAIHGFCSDSRHHVEYHRFKDFDQSYDDDAKARLAGMSGQLSTRMGAAIRHATHYLDQQKSAKKLLLVITDGEPSDVDVRERKYLHLDAKKSVEEAARSGVLTYCMSLDPGADQYVSRIFGQRNFMVVDHVERLPEKLPILYAGLTR